MVFDRPIHNVAHVPDYSERMLCSGWRRGTWDGSIAGLKHGGDGGGDALFVADDGEGVDYSPVTFLAGLPGGIHLSQLPDLRSVHCRLTTFLDILWSVHSVSICAQCTGVGTYINPSVSKLTGPVCTRILSHECLLCIRFVSYSFSSCAT